MDGQDGRLLAEIISMVGAPGFVEATSRAICVDSDFALSSVLLHRVDRAPQLMFEDLAGAGYRTGIDNYIRFTHRANPMLHTQAGQGIFRASDFRLAPGAITSGMQVYLVPAPDEELGFRTVGWPRRMEELGLYFAACGGVVELSLYRERCRRPAPKRILQSLQSIRLPLAAAFDRHAALADLGSRKIANPFSHLSPRETEVLRLLLDGCSSEAIALRLGITAYTVKDHRKSIFRKMRIGSLAELFALASANA